MVYMPILLVAAIALLCFVQENRGLSKPSSFPSLMALALALAITGAVPSLVWMFAWMESYQEKTGFDGGNAMVLWILFIGPFGSACAEAVGFMAWRRIKPRSMPR